MAGRFILYLLLKQTLSEPMPLTPTRIFVPLLFILLFLQASTVAVAQKGDDETAIRSLLMKQVAAWNEGNISAYLHGYWESDSLVFIGKSGPTYGYTATLERYKKAYPDADHMGKLTSTILLIRLLNKEWAYITGKWELARTVGNLSGYYTLLMRRIGGNWVIVEDHSS